MQVSDPCYDTAGDGSATGRGRANAGLVAAFPAAGAGRRSGDRGPPDARLRRRPRGHRAERRGRHRGERLGAHH